MTNDELEAIRVRASEIVIAGRETHERDKAVMFQAAADRRNLIAAYDALKTNALRELADAQTAYVARGMELRDAQARLAEAQDKALRFDLDQLGIEARERDAVELVELRARLAEAEQWIRNHPPRFGGDHACAQCYPHSDVLVAGFVCAYHRATDSASDCARCNGDGTVPTLDEWGGPARDRCPDCTYACQPKDVLNDGATPWDGLTCKATGDQILIAISAAALKTATDNHPEFWNGETDKYTVAVTDPQEWLKSVVLHITDEREDGSSLLTDLFDAAIKAAVENGEEGCEEVTADQPEDAA